jgi:hypothetical protein
LTEIFFVYDLIHRTAPGGYIFGFNANHLLSLVPLTKVVALTSFPLLVVAILSVVYSLFIYEFRLIAPHLEAFVHIVVLTLLLVSVIFFSGIKTDDIIIAFPLVLVFYVNTFGVTPILLKNKKLAGYVLSLFSIVLGYFLIQTILLRIFGFPPYNSETGQLLTRKDLPEIIFNTPRIIGLIFSLFLSFVYGYVRIRIKAKEKFLHIRLGEKESELKLLKSQVNPHFLFNTLNTLYATALAENADRTSASIAKLASLLRYMQKDINNDFIPLENEIKYLQDYIAIQKLRCAVEPQVETKYINIEDQLISPGLFIPFVENAFKYGIDPSKPSKLNISVICDNNNIHFLCVNSYNNEFKTFHKEQGFGIGISNAKQRLEMVYPKNHTFEILKKDNEFFVKIIIPVHKQN